MMGTTEVGTKKLMLLPMKSARADGLDGSLAESKGARVDDGFKAGDQGWIAELLGAL